MQSKDHTFDKKNKKLVPKKIHGQVDDYIAMNHPELTKKANTPVLFIFIDGIGIGDNNSLTNPFNEYSKSIFRSLVDRKYILPNHGIMVPTDPLLHVPGLPQSATGQTALFTGIDAPKLIGRHVPALPTFTLKKVIEKHSIFRRLVDNGYLPALANGYSDKYFEARRRHHSASTLCYFACGLPFRGFLDINSDRALYMDINNRYARKMGFPVKKMEAAQSAGILADLAKGHDFVMYEYFLTDTVGHTMRKGLARRSIQLIEGFLEKLLEKLDLGKIQLIITSDHGNVEDLSQKGHTLNPVPTFLWGPHSLELSKEISDIIDVHEAICKTIGIFYPDRNEKINH